MMKQLKKEKKKKKNIGIIFLGQTNMMQKELIIFELKPENVKLSNNYNISKNLAL